MNRRVIAGLLAAWAATATLAAVWPRTPLPALPTVAVLGVAFWPRLRAWRERHRTRRGTERRLRALNAWDAEDFCGKGIPRRDWARFNDELADVLWEMRAGERRRGQ